MEQRLRTDLFHNMSSNSENQLIYNHKKLAWLRNLDASTSNPTGCLSIPCVSSTHSWSFLADARAVPVVPTTITLKGVILKRKRLIGPRDMCRLFDHVTCLLGRVRRHRFNVIKYLIATSENGEKKSNKNSF